MSTIFKLQNNDVFSFDFDTGELNIHNPSLIPYYLRGRIVESDANSSFKSFRNNYESITNFLSRRSISVKRENAKAILNSLGIEQKSDTDTLLKIMVLCKGMSVSDDYWITTNGQDKWENNNLRDNPLHETLAQIALSGQSVTITGDIRTPELTNLGAYAKAWHREDGELYLYKAGTKGNDEHIREVCTSDILDRTNVPHVVYTLSNMEGRAVSRCKNICSSEFGIVTAGDFYSYCCHNDMDFLREVKKLDSEMYYKTIIVDYLIANSDRHSGNWGFFMDNATGAIERMHPLYDHNNAFDEAAMKSPDGGKCLLATDVDMKTAAKYAVRKCNFVLTDDIQRDLFPSDEAYDCFSKRAEFLGLSGPRFSKKGIGIQKEVPDDISSIADAYDKKEKDFSDDDLLTKPGE